MFNRNLIVEEYLGSLHKPFSVKKLMGVYFFLYSMSRCIDCNHKIDGTSHDRCHTHADCSRDMRYLAALCGVCHVLWDRVRDYEDNPLDAKIAFKELHTWICGYVKNSKNRERGVDCFRDPEERTEYDRLRRRFLRSSSVDSVRSSVPSQRVSIINNYLCYFYSYSIFLSI